MNEDNHRYQVYDEDEESIESANAAHEDTITTKTVITVTKKIRIVMMMTVKTTASQDYKTEMWRTAAMTTTDMMLI
jgi:hypothetical protein